MEKIKRLKEFAESLQSWVTSYGKWGHQFKFMRLRMLHERPFRMWCWNRRRVTKPRSNVIRAEGNTLIGFVKRSPKTRERRVMRRRMR